MSHCQPILVSDGGREFYGYHFRLSKSPHCGSSSPSRVQITSLFYDSITDPVYRITINGTVKRWNEFVGPGDEIRITRYDGRRDVPYPRLMHLNPSYGPAWYTEENLSVSGSCPAGTVGSLYDARIEEFLAPLPWVNVTHMSFAGYALTEVSADLFKYNPGVTDITGCFYGCSALTYLPEDVFAYLPNLRVAAFALGYTPASLVIQRNGPFQGKSTLTDVRYLFYRTRLTTIPSALLRGTSVTDATAMCYSSFITTIPTDILAYSPKLTSLKLAFASTKITSLPKILTSVNAGITNLDNAFSQNRSLTSVPTGLLQAVPNVTSAGALFANCEALTTVPADLFSYCPNLTRVQSAFMYCTRMTNVPSNLFASCPNITNVSYCFYGCTAIASAIPNMWSRSNVTTYALYARNCTKASNYSSIPAAWK